MDELLPDRTMNTIYTFAATCGAGTESLVAKEIENTGGGEIIQGRGVVGWKGRLESGLQACLWSRFSSRILLNLCTFPVSNEDSIYDGALAVDWSEHLDIETTFAVDVTVAAKEVQFHSRFAALRVKDGIVDQFREKFNARPSVEVDRPGVRIHLLLQKNTGTLSLDLSGDSLHKRGYRVEKTLAPLKENLAAAIVALSGWQDAADSDYALIDPMCGSGTLLIEAALMYGDSAPGLSRSYFGFLGWKQHDKALWQHIVEEAIRREEAGNEKHWPPIFGFDADPQAVRAARRNIARAGLEDRIHIEKAELAKLQSSRKQGLLLSNLPFGERLLEVEHAAQLYRAIGRIAAERFVGWQLAVFISSPELTDSFRLPWLEKYRLYNGPLPCRLLVTRLDIREESDYFWQLMEIMPEGEGADFANRLRKNLKRMLKTARKQGISCFRVYDRDLPDYNVSIDLYEKWVHVQEYAPPSSVDTNVASARFQLVLRWVRETLGIRSDRVFIKTRRKQRGKMQYQKKSSRRKMYEVREGACHFLVNFTDYLDTGLFLDHRPVREMIYDNAGNKRFLNLFGYTGTASVQAAAGGALSTTTVDLSQNYLDWARMNLALNGFTENRNKVIQADCMQWLKDDAGTYDLIFVDPPTFSNTKKEQRVFDIQRDHQQLLERAMEHLADGGQLLFSTNFRKFKFDPELYAKYEVTDISDSTIPFDFTRNRKIHSCWEMRKKQ